MYYSTSQLEVILLLVNVSVTFRAGDKSIAVALSAAQRLEFHGEVIPAAILTAIAFSTRYQSIAPTSCTVQPDVSCLEV